MIRIEMLPAAHGECLLVEYGSGREVHRILIDGGIAGTYRGALKERLAAVGRPCPLDLAVVTHIDEDHIVGLLTLVEEDPGAIAPKDFWFNGYQQISDLLGPKQADRLSAALLEAEYPWNAAFEGGAVAVPRRGPLPVRMLPGGAKLTLVSPGIPELALLLAGWKDELGRTTLGVPKEDAPGDGWNDELGKAPPPGPLGVGDVERLAAAEEEEDDRPANGSSIAFVLEHEGARVLFAGDGHPSVLVNGLRRLAGRLPVRLDAVKLPHHASKHNVTRELLAAVRCDTFLVSTSGGKFGHPDPEAIARIVTRSSRKTIRFNYRTPYTEPWASARLQAQFGYTATFGLDGATVVEIGPGRRAARPRRSSRPTGSGRDDSLGHAGAGAEDAGDRFRGFTRAEPSPLESLPSDPPRTEDGRDDAREERFAHARVTAREEGTPVEVRGRPLPANAPCEVSFWIAPPSADGLRADAPVDESMLPPSDTGHALTVVFADPGLSPEPQVAEVHLPKRGPSTRCTFGFETGGAASALDARITVLHQNRILQTLRLTGGVEDRAEEPAPLALYVESVVRAEPRPGEKAFDAALLVNRGGDGDRLAAYRDGKVAYVSTKGLDDAIEGIRAELEKVSGEPERYGTPGEGDTDELLLSLARMGERLHAELLELPGMRAVLGSGAPLERVQIVSMHHEDILPLEFCYRREPPLPNARVCPEWPRALKDGRCDGPCPGADAELLCVLGFLGMTATIERHRYDENDHAMLRGHGAQFAVERGPEAEPRTRLDPLRSLLQGVVSSAPGPNAATFRSDLAAIAAWAGTAADAGDWGQWTREVARLHPGLLLLIAHTEQHSTLNLLVIGNQQGLPIGNIGDAHVVGAACDRAVPPPIVLLLGCRTGRSDVAFANFASQFRRKGAAIVVGTVASIRGRYAAETARHIVQEIATCARQASSFGDVLTSVRRQLLRKGNPVGLCLTAFGDADWLL